MLRRSRQNGAEIQRYLRRFAGFQTHGGRADRVTMLAEQPSKNCAMAMNRFELRSRLVEKLTTDIQHAQRANSQSAGGQIAHRRDGFQS